MSKTGKGLIAAVVCILLATAVIFALSEKRDEVFTDQMGRTVRLTDFKDRVVMINFIFTTCPNKGCDLITLQFLRLQNLLKDRLGRDVILLSISIDPEKDTPNVLKNYALKFKADHNKWLFLTSNTDTAESLSKRYGVLWKTEQDGSRHHRVVMALLNKHGKTVTVYNDVDYDAEKIELDIRKALEADI